MKSPAPPMNVLESLERISEYVRTSPADAPAEFVRDLAHRWKERGGHIAGKPRHSDRYLDDLLRARGTPIKSLTPKLVGRTNLKPADADVLVRLFLSHWDYIGDPNSGEITERYAPMLSGAEIEGVCRYVAEQITVAGVEVKTEVEAAIAAPATGQDTPELIEAEYRKSVALFTVGAGQAVLHDRPEGALIGFRNVLNRLWAIDRSDRQERILVWTLDLGRQDFDDPESRLRFMSVEALISRFKALRRFKESASEERWNWLSSKVAIVLHDTLSVRPDMPRLPAFDPHHVLFSAIPPRWAGTPEFFALYGTERLQQAVYTIFLAPSARSAVAGQSSQTLYDISQPCELRYFGHALLDEKGERREKGFKLTAPGRSYVEALGTVFAAAAQKLGIHKLIAELSIEGMKISPSHAVEKLRHHGFILLNLEEFLSF